MTVEALAGRDWDQATDAYYNMLVPVLDEMEEQGASGFMQSPESD